MTDIVEKLKRIADAAGYTDGTDTPLGEQVRAGANEIERLRSALQFIADGYDNQDVNHVDYRVKVYQVALDALSLTPADGKTP